MHVYKMPQNIFKLKLHRNKFNIIYVRELFFKFCLSFACFTFLIPWPVQVGPVSLVSTDITTLLFCSFIVLTLLTKKTWKIAPSVLVFLGFLLLWQFLMTVAWMVNPGQRGMMQLVWHIFKNTWWMIPYAIIGILLAKSSLSVKRHFIASLLFWASVSALIGIVQTASSGNLLSGLATNQRFLGFLTPLPPDRFAYMDFDAIREQARTGLGGGIFFGPIFRAHGPFSEPNLFTATMVPIVCFTVGLLITDPSVKSIRGVWLALLLTLLASIISFGIAGYFALLCVFACICIVRWHTVLRQLFKIRLLLLGGGLILGLIFLLIMIEPSRILTPEQSASLAQRFNRLTTPLESVQEARGNFWAVAIERIQQSPWLGTGKILEQRDFGWNVDGEVSVMNMYLYLALVTGIPSQIGFVLLLFIFLWTSWRVAQSNLDIQTRSIASACFLLFLSVVVMGVTYDWLGYEGIGHLFLISGGMCVTFAAQIPRCARYQQRKADEAVSPATIRS